MRLFVASSFEPGFVDNLKAIADYARANADREAVKWVEPVNFHVTYAFLGELDRSGAAAAARGIEAGLGGVKAFRISSGGFGVFPSSRRPSVMWVGIDEGASELSGVAGKLAEGLAAAGLVFENRFQPHVTIGRVKGSLPENFIRRAADFTRAKKAVSAVSSVELMESVPAGSLNYAARSSPSGPAYRQVYSKRL